MIQHKASKGGVFAFGEDTLTLRLTSELVDLRVEYANPRTLRCSVRDRPTSPKTKGQHKADLLSLAQREGFEPSCAFGTN